TVFALSYLVLIFALIYMGIGQTVMALKLARGIPAHLGDLFAGGKHLLPVLGASFLASLAGGLASAISFGLLGIYLALCYWPFYYLIVDDKASALGSFSRSYKMTTGNRETTFVLWLASVGIILLGLLA